MSIMKLKSEQFPVTIKFIEWVNQQKPEQQIDDALVEYEEYLYGDNPEDSEFVPDWYNFSLVKELKFAHNFNTNYIEDQNLLSIFNYIPATPKTYGELQEFIKNKYTF